MADSRQMTLGVLFKMSLGDVVSKTTKLNKTIDNLNSSTKQASTSATGLQKGLTGIGTQADRASGSVQKLVNNFKLLASFRGLAAVQNGLVAGAAAVVDYSQALANVQAITRETDTVMGILGDKMISIANDQIGRLHK